jgi:hypothetical protein
MYVLVLIVLFMIVFFLMSFFSLFFASNTILFLLFFAGTSKVGNVHFTCTGCIAGHVDEESTGDLRDVVKRGARVFCPMKCEGCTSEAFPDVLLANQLRNNPISLQRYFSARKRLLESQASEQADNRIKIELDRLIHMDEKERVIYSKRR